MRLTAKPRCAGLLAAYQLHTVWQTPATTSGKDVGQWLVCQNISIAARRSEERVMISRLVTGGHWAGGLGRRGQRYRWLASRSDVSAACTTLRLRILRRENIFGSFL